MIPSLLTAPHRITRPLIQEAIRIIEEPMPTCKAISPEEYLARVSAAMPPFFEELDRLKMEASDLKEALRISREQIEVKARELRAMVQVLDKVTAPKSRWERFKQLCKGK